jgi:hypothetical protein
MFIKTPLTGDFRPSYEKDYVAWSKEINVQIENTTLPGQSPRLEIFVFAIYHKGELVDSGTFEWDTHNGMLMHNEAAKAVVLQWDPYK